VLKAAGVPHVGTHDIHHRLTTDIANSGLPIKVGMALPARSRCSGSKTRMRCIASPAVGCA